jgi:hypothetical protein
MSLRGLKLGNFNFALFSTHAKFKIHCSLWCVPRYFVILSLGSLCVESCGLSACWNSSSIGCLEFWQHGIKPQWWHNEKDQSLEMLGQFCSCLPYFATFHANMCKSNAQLTGSSLQLFYSWNSATISSSCYGNNCHPQIHSAKEDQSPHISRGSQIILILSLGISFYSYLKVHS